MVSLLANLNENGHLKTSILAYSHGLKTIEKEKIDAVLNSLTLAGSQHF
jgi:hypothetical protein